MTTIQVSLLSLLLGTLFGLLMGMIRVLGPRFLHPFVNAYVTFVRGTPVAVQIYAAFFLLPRIGLNWSLFEISVFALTFNSVGYQIEIIRAALQSIDKGQHEAAAAIGLGKWKAMWLITLPQAAQRMIPPLTNELANLIKASSVLSIIALYELTRAGEAIIASTFRYAEVLILMSILYFLMIQSLTEGSNYLEKNVFNFRTSRIKTRKIKQPAG
ncbi:MAG: amino acid ABC transporter permease [Anaerolineae bacterium]|nr:amino acid ABC transporter permease [Anaerolineae bacterium]